MSIVASWRSRSLIILGGCFVEYKKRTRVACSLVGLDYCILTGQHPVLQYSAKV